ncbi:MAG TPA: hypothetical protein VN915_09990 [Elusimicrobiota bacterium]|nr:hypothetical protein [Elusimicrobiota bacterium]
MKRATPAAGRRHGLRARIAGEGRAEKTVVTFERRAQVYCWTTDRGRRPVVKH